MTTLFFGEADSWTDGAPYRLHVRGQFHIRYGMQLRSSEFGPPPTKTSATVSTSLTSCPTASFRPTSSKRSCEP